MNGAKTRGAGGAAGPWKAAGNGETARPVHVMSPAGRHASPFFLTWKAAHRGEQSVLAHRGPCPCRICTYVPRHAAPLGPTFPLAA